MTRTPASQVPKKNNQPKKTFKIPGQSKHLELEMKPGSPALSSRASTNDSFCGYLRV